MDEKVDKLADDNLNILKKMALVMADVEYIQKDATNKHQNYRYASEAAIKEKLHAALVKHKVVLQLNTGIPTIVGGALIVPCEYIFWDVESGESLAGHFVGSGHTRDEKGLYAAITGFIKYLLTGTFLIATGDDAESDDNEKPKKEPAPKTEPQPKADPKPEPDSRIRAQMIVIQSYLSDPNYWETLKRSAAEGGVGLLPKSVDTAYNMCVKIKESKTPTLVEADKAVKWLNEQQAKIDANERGK